MKAVDDGRQRRQDREIRDAEQRGKAGR